MKSLFVKYVLVYLCCGLIVLAVSAAITVNAGNTIRDFAVNQWKQGKQEGIGKLAGSLESAVSLSRLLTADNDFSSLVNYSPQDPRDITINLMNAFDVFSETGIIMSDFNFAFTVFKRNSIFLSTDSCDRDFSFHYDTFMDVWEDGRRIESAEEFKQLLFSSFAGGLGYLTLDRFYCSSGSRAVMLDDPVLILTSSDSLFGRPMYVTAFVLDPAFVVDQVLKPDSVKGGFLQVRMGDDEIVGYGEYNPDKADYHIEEDIIPEVGLNLLTGIPVSYFYNETRQVTSIMLLYLLCGGAAALAFSLFMGGKRFGSVKRLYSDVLGKDMPQEGNEYESISDNIREIKTESSEYKRQVEVLQQQNLAVRLYSFCLSGIHGPGELAHFERIFPETPECYVLAVTSVCSSDSGDEEIVLSIADGIRDAGISFIHIPAGDGDEIFLCGLGEEEGDAQAVAGIFSRVSGESEEIMHTGISLPFSSPGRIDRAYSEAKQIVQSLYAREQESIVEVYQGDPGNELAECPLTVSSAGRLSSMLSCGKREEAYLFLDDLGAYFKAHPFAFEKMKGDFWFLLDFAFKASEPGFDLGKDMVFSKKMTQQEFIIGFKSRIDRLCAYQDSSKKSHNDKLCQDIVSYIGKEYTNPALTAAMVSAEMGISEKYLSQFLKEQTGYSFSDTLRKIRIDAAVRYLETTDYSNERIAELIGFGGINTFYRNFSRQLGVTPKAYRDNFLNNKE